MCIKEEILEEWTEHLRLDGEKTVNRFKYDNNKKKEQKEDKRRNGYYEMLPETKSTRVSFFSLF